MIEVSHFHRNADKTFNKSSQQSTYSEPFGIVSEQEENDKSLLSKQSLSNPLALMVALNLARLALIWFQGKIDEIRQRRQQASPELEEGEAFEQKLLDEVASRIEESSRLVAEGSDLARQLKEMVGKIRNLKGAITSVGNASKVNEEIQQLLDRLDAMLSNVALPPSTTFGKPPTKEPRTILKAFLLLKSWLE